ncbi:MAG: OmpH family outer membrane protein [Pyrinomonadaceae bacterium]
MTTFRLITVAFFLTAIFAVSAFAQAAQPAASGKIVYINVGAFDDDKGAGITKYVTAMNALTKEFQPTQTNLDSMVAKYTALGNEIKVLQDNATRNPNVPIDQKSAQAKVEQYQQMERDIKFQQEDAKAKYQSRYSVVVGPIMQDIMKSLQDFAKQKNYSMILDAAKLDEAGIILAVGNDNADVTKDFITFYNSRPAGTATTATPR